MKIKSHSQKWCQIKNKIYITNLKASWKQIHSFSVKKIQIKTIPAVTVTAKQAADLTCKIDLLDNRQLTKLTLAKMTNPSILQVIKSSNVTYFRNNVYFVSMNINSRWSTSSNSIAWSTL